MRWRSLLILAMLFVASFIGVMGGVCVTPAQAQGQYTLEVRAGYNGTYRPSEWFPVSVEVGNTGPDLHGTLEWQSLQGDAPPLRQAIDLPQGSHKRITLDVIDNGFSQQARLKLLNGSQVVAQRDITLNAVSRSEAFLIGVISSDPSLLNNLNALIQPNVALVRHLALIDLPEHSSSLSGLDVLVIHDVDTAALSQAQRDALTIWVSLGGQLVVSGGAHGLQTAAGLGDLLPIQLGSAMTQGDISVLKQFTQSVTPPPHSTSILNSVQPRPGAQLLEPNGLLISWLYGNGKVTFSTFDLVSLRGWVDENTLWEKVISQPMSLFKSFNGNLLLSQANLLEDGGLIVATFPFPSVGLLLIGLLIYVLAIGPLNYLLLRRLRRLEWAWISIPAIVLISAGTLYVVGFGGRGNRLEINQVTIVQGTEGQSYGLATSFVGVFSSLRGNHTLEFEPNALLSIQPTYIGGNVQQSFAIAADESGTRKLELQSDIASVTTFVVSQDIAVEPTIQSTLTLNQRQLQGQVRNTGTVTLEDALIIRGTAYNAIGTLAPGTSLTFQTPDRSLLDEVNIADVDPFNRQRILADLARQIQINELDTTNQTNNIYLVGWVRQPLIAAHPVNESAQQHGLVLYIIQLKPTSK